MPYVGQCPVQRLVDRIQLSWPVQNDRAHRTVGLDLSPTAIELAKAEAANYPFCTIDPNVGVVTGVGWYPAV